MQNFNIKDLLYFDKMIIQRVITFIYWIVMVMAALAMFANGLRFFSASPFGGLLLIVVGIPILLLVVRLYFELIIVLFKIYENTKKIADK